MKSITITNFIKDHTGYKSYWKHENQNKNAIFPEEGLKVVARKILFACKELNLNDSESKLTRKIASDTGLYHVSGEGSVQDTVKGMASVYKRQPEACLLLGDGAFPTSASNHGAAARYTSVFATPLSMQVFKDIDFCPWVVDDSGVEQVDVITMPYPYALINGYKGIGVGRSCYICERPHDEVYKWSKKIVDIAFPDKEGSHWTERFLESIDKNGSRITQVKDIREYNDNSIFHDEVKDMTKILKVKAPLPFNYTGAICEYNEAKHQVMMSPRIETEVKNRATHYYITALPIESSDKIVLKNIMTKYPSAVADKCVDYSGDGCPVKLEIPKAIATDESLWFGLRMKRGFTEAYCIWDREADTVHIIANLHPIVLDWYQKREEVVTRRLYHSIAGYNLKIHNNSLIKKYYEYDQAGKIHTEADVVKLFNEADARYLINLPEKTFIKENVDKIDALNKALEEKIKETRNNLANIKEFIFNEWKTIAEANRKFIESRK